MSIDLTGKYCVMCNRGAQSFTNIAYPEYIQYLAPTCDILDCTFDLSIFNENKKSNVLYRLASSKLDNNLISSFN